MAGSEHKRQKALAKKRKREKEIRKARNTASNLSTRDFVLQLARGAWHACFEVGDMGMNQITCVRRAHSGYGASIFLLDEYCIGVKDADVLRDVSMDRLREVVNGRGGSEISPAYALKKLQAMIEWSRGIGFEPHPKTSMAMQVFRDVDANDCSTTFSFGRPEDGKPLYIAGPNDGPERIQDTMQKLQKLGEGNYHFLFNASSDNQLGDFGGKYLNLGDGAGNDEDYDDPEILDDTLLNIEAIESDSKP